MFGAGDDGFVPFKLRRAWLYAGASAFNTETPVAVRYPREEKESLRLDCRQIISKPTFRNRHYDGSYGIMIYEILAAADILAKEGIRATLSN